MNSLSKNQRSRFSCLVVVILALPLVGCGPNYRELRLEGQKAFLGGAFGPARILFAQAEDRSPRHVENLHDLGVCCVMLARERFDQMNHPAALREVDNAIAYYQQALDVYPGHQASLVGLNISLELKGQFDEALEAVEWAARFVGPAARQYVFLAKELEERGDRDGAFLRYRQAVAIEPQNAETHRAFAQFLLTHNNEPAAVHHLQRAYHLDPRNQWVVKELIARSALPPLAAQKENSP